MISMARMVPTIVALVIAGLIAFMWRIDPAVQWLPPLPVQHPDVRPQIEPRGDVGRDDEGECRGCGIQPPVMIECDAETLRVVGAAV